MEVMLKIRDLHFPGLKLQNEESHRHGAPQCPAAAPAVGESSLKGAEQEGEGLF